MSIRAFERNTIKLNPTDSKAEHSRSGIAHSKSRLSQARKIARAILSDEKAQTEARLVEIILSCL